MWEEACRMHGIPTKAADVTRGRSLERQLLAKANVTPPPPPPPLPERREWTWDPPETTPATAPHENGQHTLAAVHDHTPTTDLDLPALAAYRRGQRLPAPYDRDGLMPTPATYRVPMDWTRWEDPELWQRLNHPERIPDFVAWTGRMADAQRALAVPRGRNGEDLTADEDQEV